MSPELSGEYRMREQFQSAISAEDAERYDGSVPRKPDTFWGTILGERSEITVCAANTFSEVSFLWNELKARGEALPVYLCRASSAA